MAAQEKQEVVITQELLFDYVTENLDESTNHQVEKWLNASPENRVFIERLKKLWSTGQSYSLFDESDLT